MKKILLLLLIVTSNLFSQPRTNEVRPEFEKVGKSLNEVVGWTFGSTKGVWVESKKENGLNSLGEISFYNMFFTKLKYENIDYYILNIVIIDGAYKYPTIKSGFYTYKLINSYIFEEKDYLKLKNYENGNSKYSQIHTLIDSEIIEEKELSDLRDNVLTTLKSNYSNKESFKIKKESDDLIRFILPLKSEYKILEKNWGFDKKYFEVSKTEFDKIFE